MKKLVLLSLLAVPAFAQQVYTWEDKDGVHYTDDPAQVPKNARKAASANLPSQPSAVVTPTEAGPLPRTEARPAPAPNGLDERRWRDRFIDAYRRIETLKNSISTLTAALPSQQTCSTLRTVTGATVTTGTGGVTTTTPTTGTATGPYTQQCFPNPQYERMAAELAQKKVELNDATLDIDRLEREASMAGVPREWRRGW